MQKKCKSLPSITKASCFNNKSITLSPMCTVTQTTAQLSCIKPLIFADVNNTGFLFVCLFVFGGFLGLVFFFGAFYFLELGQDLLCMAA